MKKHNEEVEVINEAPAVEEQVEAPVAEEPVSKKAAKKAKKAAKKAKKLAKKRRLRSKGFRTLLKGLFGGAILGAIVNVIVGFVNKAVYTLVPSGSAEMSDDLLFDFNNRFTLDLNAVIDHAVEGVIYGAVICVVLALVVIICRAIAESCRFRRVSPIREALDSARGIKCESFAKIKALPKGANKVKKCNKKGNLFLTPVSLEFYGKKFKNPKKNLLIKLSDVSFIKRRGSRKLILITTDGKYVVRVPKHTAKRWQKAILRAVKAK